MTERIIDLYGKKLFVKFNDQFKNRPTIIFLHDSLGSSQLWRDFPEQLGAACHCNILMYDRLGYGKSFPMASHRRENNYMELEADLLNDLMAELNIAKVILFGHSDGGTIALIAASKYGQKIEAVICEAGHIFVEDITVKGVADALKAYQITNLPDRLRKYHGDKVKTLVKAWTEIWLNEKFRNWSIEYLLADINVPLLFIQGENDEYGTLQQVDKTVSQVSGRAEKYIIPKTSHTPHKEFPELVLNRSAEFVNSIINGL